MDGAVVDGAVLGASVVGGAVTTGVGVVGEVDGAGASLDFPEEDAAADLLEDLCPWLPCTSN